MKKLISLLAILIVSFCLQSQNISNPYASIGKKKPKVATVTNGSYNEFYIKDSLVLINDNAISRKTGDIVYSKKDNLKIIAELIQKEEDKFRFLSTDPISASYPELTPYQFASNTPIQAIDMDGLEAFFIHGTWGNNTAWLKNGTANELTQNLQGLFGNSTSFVPNNGVNKKGEPTSWSGGNYAAARQQAAKDMVSYVKAHRIHGEPITLVGHSHGGNVAILVANLLAADPDLEGISIQLLTMNTPVREYQLSPAAEKITTHYQVFTTSNIVQKSGGDNITLGKKPGELFGAGREFMTASNIYYNSPAKTFDINGNHQGWAPMNSKIWLPKLKEKVAETKGGGGDHTYLERPKPQRREIP